MADIRKLAPLILKWEGKFVDDPADAGGPTHMGVTLRTLINAGFDKNKDGLIDLADLKALNEHDVVYCFLKPFYWDRWQADRIQNQSIANLLVDWVWMSGKVGITIPQDVLGVKVDGIVGEKTLMAINQNKDQYMLFHKLKHERKMYIERICQARPSNRKFQQGWLNRLADFRFGCIVLLLSLCFSWGGCKSTAQLGLGISESTETISDSLLRDEQTNFSTELHRDYSSEEILDELIIIKLDSCPVTFDWLAKEVTGISNGLVIRRKQKRIKKNDYQQQALETRLQTTTKEVVEKKQLKKEIQQPKMSNQKIAGYLFLSIFLLLVVSVLSNFYRKK